MSKNKVMFITNVDGKDALFKCFAARFHDDENQFKLGLTLKSFLTTISLTTLTTVKELYANFFREIVQKTSKQECFKEVRRFCLYKKESF